MVRFKVIKASRLLLYIAIGVLALVLCILLFRYTLNSSNASVNTSANLVDAAMSDEAKTQMVFASSDETRSSDELPLDPGDGPSIEIEILTDSPNVSSVSPTPNLVETPVPNERPSVLIYHTHTHEAYEQVSDDPYVALEAWRTTDADHSVVRVGEELTRLLEGYGFEVVHDVTDHEGNDLSTAYTRSLDTLMGYERTFDLYIDLHRDAFVDGMDVRLTTDDGKDMAQLMMLIGNGNGFEVKPYYTQNYAFARALTERINAEQPGLCKDVLVKDGRYNQNIGVFSILVEVGHNLNTLQESLASVPSLAKGIYSLMIESPDPQLTAMQAAFMNSQQ